MGVIEKKLKSFLPRLGILLVLLSFGVMTGFASVLHAHELDFNSAHDDCAPCHWSKTNPSDETTATAFATAPLLQFSLFSPGEFISQQFKKNILNRGPPTFS